MHQSILSLIFNPKQYHMYIFLNIKTFKITISLEAYLFDEFVVILFFVILASMFTPCCTSHPHHLASSLILRMFNKLFLLLNKLVSVLQRWCLCIYKFDQFYQEQQLSKFMQVTMYQFSRYISHKMYGNCAGLYLAKTKTNFLQR